MHSQNDGISLRTIQFWLIIGAMIISGMMFFSTYHLSIGFKSINDTYGHETGDKVLVNLVKVLKTTSALMIMSAALAGMNLWCSWCIPQSCSIT